MIETVLVAVAFAVLLGLEWRSRRRGARVGTALLALAVLWLFQPDYTSARRRALGAPPSERVTFSPIAGSEANRLSEYQSGVYTTMRAIEYFAGAGAGARLAALGALFWLACSPARRQPRGPSDTDGARVSSGAGAPEA